MHAKLVEVGAKLASRLSSGGTTVRTTFSRLKSSEVAEALIATWCIEFLRMRRMGGFNVVELVVISILMIGVRTIITEASRRKSSGHQGTMVMSNRYSQMEPVGHPHHPVKAGFWDRHWR